MHFQLCPIRYNYAARSKLACGSDAATARAGTLGPNSQNSARPGRAPARLYQSNKRNTLLYDVVIIVIVVIIVTRVCAGRMHTCARNIIHRETLGHPRRRRRDKFTGSWSQNKK